MLRNSSGPVFAIDGRQRIVAMSEDAPAALGWPEDAVGRYCYELVSGRDSTNRSPCGIECSFVQAFRGGRPVAPQWTTWLHPERGAISVACSAMVLPPEAATHMGAVAIFTVLPTGEEPAHENPLRAGGHLSGPRGLALDTRSHVATVGQQALELTAREFLLLRMLLERRGEVLELETLSRGAWGRPLTGSGSFVQIAMSRLRAKLRAAGADGIITTVRSVGYVIR